MSHSRLIELYQIPSKSELAVHSFEGHTLLLDMRFLFANRFPQISILCMLYSYQLCKLCCAVLLPGVNFPQYCISTSYARCTIV
jgi:hypothetical protein